MNNEDLQRLVTESLGGCSWELDVAREKISYSDDFLALLGYAPDEREIETSWVSDNIHPKDLSQWREAYVRHIRGKSRFFDCELRFRHKQDYYIWIQTRGLAIERDENGWARRIVGLVFDISERMTAKESESRYRLFLDNIPVAISLKDRGGRYLYINRQFESWIGKPSYQIYGQTADEVFESSYEELAMLREHEEKVWAQGQTISMERTFPRTEDGRLRNAAVTKFPVFDEMGRMLAIGSTNSDITERDRAQEAVRMSEVRYRRLFESAPVALFESDWSSGKALIDDLRAQGVEDFVEYFNDHPELLRRRDEALKLINCNREALRMYRSGSNEELYRLVEGELHAEERLALASTLQHFASGMRRSQVRSVGMRSDREPFHMVRETELISSDREDWSRVLTSIHDMTAEVEAANRLQEYQVELRSLAGKISLAEEVERRRIASELHDGTIQNLVLARIQLANLKGSVGTQKTTELTESIDELLQRSLRESRSLIFEISPPVLYELGLKPAVEWLAEHYRQRTGVEVRIEGGEGEADLSEELKIVVFQAARELLVNVAKHAQANQVSLCWRHNAETLQLNVADDGVGFDLDGEELRRATEGGFGLFSIRERLKLLGAELNIQSSSAGTQVTITAPLLTAEE